ncbi:MAG: type I restriction-modification system subunit M [Verrucomicrobiota bacterium]
MTDSTPDRKDEINRVAWKACDTFRGVMDSSVYKDYVLTMLFLKYLSDVRLQRVEELREQFGKDKAMIERRLSRERFIIPETATFQTLYKVREADNIGELINGALDLIEDENKAKLDGVFRKIDFNSEVHLGETRDRNRRLRNLLEDFAPLDLRPKTLGSADLIGDCYEYLIARFASDAGKKGGEFYTPSEVATLLAKLLSPQPGDRICDPACGSGSLLIKVAHEIGNRNVAVYGMENNNQTYALARMNMFLHNLDNARIEWCDSLNSPKLVEDARLLKFDIVVANPPFSLDKWGAPEAAGDPHKRFHRGIPPKSRGDYAFISHMIETAVAGSGKVGVVVPHGVLFRGAAEGKIRQSLVEENLIEAVIGLPSNLFYGTGIPAAIIIFNKGKEAAKRGTDILFIDASREFQEGTNQNRLRPEDIQKIVSTFRAFKTIPSYARRVPVDEVKENDFNLNIPRYVDTFREEEPVNLSEVQADIAGLEKELAKVRSQILAHLGELGIK